MKDSWEGTAYRDSDGSWVRLMEEQGFRRLLVVADTTDRRRLGEQRSLVEIA
jgi:hypothetical protein